MPKYKILLLVFLTLGLPVIILIIFIKSPAREKVKPEPVFCTMDAKICPDGSAVGRIPPECNFAPCPR